MKFFLDFLPGLAFLVALFIPEDRQQGLYLATQVLIVTSLLQIFLVRLLTGKIEKQYVVIFLVVLVLGAATLLLKDERFIKWKPTIVFWIFSLAFLVSDHLGSRNLTQRLLGQVFNAPQNVWRQANLSFVGFFMLCGFINLFVVYNFSTEVWAMFKLFGFLALNVVYLLGLVMFLSRYAVEQPPSSKD
ncbi:MAG: septation protein IspZ [Gammaproteobacteria bacterium]|nr:septation protein IspZ [Gammaproteobacteria bacterium]MCY4211001.1 septation protein IspZ [Gammaproteobacteria bacterium]MCY4283695.1 septation protein IspZ [Gammaproteobacteria bacterium]MCY4339121.1 septation protein IspZ [Gammaproteobacteria bacterium]